VAVGRGKLSSHVWLDTTILSIEQPLIASENRESEVQVTQYNALKSAFNSLQTGGINSLREAGVCLGGVNHSPASLELNNELAIDAVTRGGMVVPKPGACTYMAY
jgi:hypothetical protein